MPFVTVGKEYSSDVRIHFEEYGRGKPVILIHGYPQSGRAWERQIPALVEAGYRAIIYDRRGFGLSSQPWNNYNFDVFAEDLHKLIGSLNFRGVTLVGHSMGAGEVARYIGKYGTENVEKAVFIAGVPPYLLKTADNPEGLDGATFENIKAILAADRPAFMSKFCREFYNADVLTEALMGDTVTHAGWSVSVDASPKADRVCVDTWVTDFREDVKRIDIPTLVIQGDSDRIVPLEASGARLPELIRDCKLVVIKGGPHGIGWTHADQVNQALIRFLATDPCSMMSVGRTLGRSVVSVSI
jgi:non-heme chloroperoxidase